MATNPRYGDNKSVAMWLTLDFGDELPLPFLVTPLPDLLTPAFPPLVLVEEILFPIPPNGFGPPKLLCDIDPDWLEL